MHTQVRHSQVEFNDKFWLPRLVTNRGVTLPIEYEQNRKTGRLDAWRWKKGRSNPPHIFWDSDVGKWLEAVGYSLETHPDRKLQKLADRVIADMAGAQQADGYLNSYFQFVEPDKRWTNLRDSHELYCSGHLIEGAIAYSAATGDEKFLDIMRRNADHINRVFGQGKGQKRGYCGHEEIELALVKLFQVTREKKYLDLAKYFIEERGRAPHYFTLEAVQRGEKMVGAPHSYCQAHVPVRKQKEAVGHSVRAMYLYTAMAAIARETCDRSLLHACRRMWESVTNRRMYITGGIGSSRMWEQFTCDYDLPNDLAYAETCAAIGLVFFAHQLLLADSDSQYADVMERALYNGVMSGVSLDGKRFFYANPLTAHPVSYSARPGDDHCSHTDLNRQEWFDCACCPPNIARLLASLGQYFYSQDGDVLFVHLFAASTTECELQGQTVTVRQQTQYPWKERVLLTVSPSLPGVFTVAFRIPGWCRGATLTVNERRVKIAEVTRKGYAYLKREWNRGDRIELVFPMPVERIESRPEVRSNCGMVSLQRGPVVYCLEETDNGGNLADITLPRSSKFNAKWEKSLLGGCVTISGQAVRRDCGAWKDKLYQPAGTGLKRIKLKAIPYCLWNNRGPGEMLVWIRATP